MSSATPAREPARTSVGTHWERAWFTLVIGTWLVAWVAAHVYIARFAQRAPYADDTAFIELLRPDFAPDLLPWVWGLHNEHRVFVPKLAVLALHACVPDFRVAMHVQAAVYAACALACVLAARRLRPGTRPWDAFFPLMWLQIGNCENLLMAFQLCMAIPVACVCTTLFATVFSDRRLSPSHAIPAAIAVVILPLCGGMGVSYAPPLAIWIGLLGWKGRRSSESSERASARILLASCAVTFAIVAFYFVDYARPPGAEYGRPLATTLAHTFAELTVAFGIGWVEWWPASGLVLATVLATLVGVALRRWRKTGRFDALAVGLLVHLAAGVGLALVIAHTRPLAPDLGIPNRYTPLPAPFFAAVYLGCLVMMPRVIREAPGVLCFVAMAQALPASVDYACWIGAGRRAETEKLDALVAAVASPREIHGQYVRTFIPGFEEEAGFILETCALHRWAPFDRAADYAREDFRLQLLCAQPTVVESNRPFGWRSVDNVPVVRIGADEVLHFAVEPAHGTVQGRIGLPAKLLARGESPGARLTVERVPDEGPPAVLGTVVLDPRIHTLGTDGLVFDFSFPPGGRGEIVLRFECPDPAARANGWVKLQNLFIL